MIDHLVENVIYYRNIKQKGTFQLPKEKIYFYELTFVLDGELTYIADGETYVLKKNDVILLPPDTVRLRPKKFDAIWYVSFNFTLLPNVQLNLSKFIYKGISNDIKRMLSAFPQNYISISYNHSKEKLVCMAEYILFELLDFNTSNSNNEYVTNAIKYIDSHVNQKLSLQSISKVIGISKEYLANIFKKEMGCTVTCFINDRKMYLAKDIISTNEMSLNDLSNYLGFDSYSYFSKLFKHHFGLSPQEFKIKIRTPAFHKTE